MSRYARVGTRPFVVSARLVAVLVLANAAVTASAKLETWKQETSTAFRKGQRERVVISESGRVRLGQPLAPAGKVDAARIWDLARTPKGTLLAATGDSGKVFRRDDPSEGTWSLAFDADDTQVLSLVTLADGRILAGTGPSGRLIDLTDPRKPSSLPSFGPGVKYVWDLAADARGNVYAATGPTGQLWKVAADGKRTLLLDSKHPHLLCVAVTPDGQVYTGSDGEGLIYGVSPEGKVSVVYDAPQSEVRCLLLTPDGTLYAGTAAESSGSGGSGRGSSLFSGTTLANDLPEKKSSVASTTEPPKSSTSSGSRTKPSTDTGGTASPRTPTAGENAIYRIGRDGVPREILKAKALFFALAWEDGRLLAGTGPEGQLYEVRDAGHESAPIARLDHGQILAMLNVPTGGLLLGTGDPGAVVELHHGFVPAGSLVSEVHDAKLLSRFGSLDWRAETPPGTALTLQARTGNVAEPDLTWSDWSPELSDPDSSRPHVPPGRFIQYRANFSTRDPKRTPELRSVSLRYQTANLPPEFTKLEVPDLAVGDGAAKQTKLTLKWDASDPNGDDLRYTVQARKEGWPDWIRLGDEHHTSSSYEWDTTTVPGGRYRVRILASDRLSNNPDDTLTSERTSETFLVDHDVPAVAIQPRDQGAAILLKDDLTRIVKASYSLDGGDWTPIFPDDGLFDSLRESITLTLDHPRPGTHLLVVRTTDAAGNVGAGDALILVKNEPSRP